VNLPPEQPMIWTRTAAPALQPKRASRAPTGDSAMGLGPSGKTRDYFLSISYVLLSDNIAYYISYILVIAEARLSLETAVGWLRLSKQIILCSYVLQPAYVNTHFEKYLFKFSICDFKCNQLFSDIYKY
jgi:hypothetical protein